MISSTMQNTSIWMMPFRGGVKFFEEGSKHCFMTPTGLPMCRCTFAKKRNYELCYSLLLAVYEEQLHIATRLRYNYSYILLPPASYCHQSEFLCNYSSNQRFCSKMLYLYCILIPCRQIL